jgi:hypothetical protein
LVKRETVVLAESGGIGQFWQTWQHLMRDVVLGNGLFDKWMQFRFVHHASPK